jgi:hypothetical protein
MDPAMLLQAIDNFGGKIGNDRTQVMAAATVESHKPEEPGRKKHDPGTRASLSSPAPDLSKNRPDSGHNEEEGSVREAPTRTVKDRIEMVEIKLPNDRVASGDHYLIEKGGRAACY